MEERYAPQGVMAAGGWRKLEKGLNLWEGKRVEKVG